MANWRSRDPTRASTVGTYPALEYRPGSWPREASINGIHPGLPGQLVRAALRSPEDHDASDLRRRLDRRWSIQVPTGLRRLIGSDDLGRGPRPAELVAAVVRLLEPDREREPRLDRKSTRLNSSHSQISYAVFCLKKQNADIPCGTVPRGLDIQ